MLGALEPVDHRLEVELLAQPERHVALRAPAAAAEVHRDDVVRGVERHRVFEHLALVGGKSVDEHDGHAGGAGAVGRRDVPARDPDPIAGDDRQYIDVRAV